MSNHLKKRRKGKGGQGSPGAEVFTVQPQPLWGRMRGSFTLRQDGAGFEDMSIL